MTTRTAWAGLTGLAAVAATATVAACGSTPAPTSAGQPASSPASSPTPSGGASLQASTGLCAAVPKLTALTVHRVNALPQNHLKFVFPATEVVTSAVTVQTVAKSLCALPPQTGSVACPNDNGVSYQLTFVEGSQRFTPVTANASGCAVVKGLGQPRAVDPATSLWQDLGLAIGVPHPQQNSFSGSQATTNNTSS
ncbi:MAG TPA: hypothetical protein VGI00_24430 [Streptosporangiaceae bacterium]|jgi:hypothetical protein